MHIKVKLFPLDRKAADGSMITRQVFEEYLRSEDYQMRSRNKLFLGGVTHIDRNKPDKQTGLGEFDRMLTEGNYTHYTDKLFIGPDNWVYARAKVMDNLDEYAGRSLELIKTLTRLLKQGIKLPVSIVVKAYWDKNDVARKIVLISGFDVTLSPGYKGAEIVDIENDDNAEFLAYGMEDEEPVVPQRFNQRGYGYGLDYPTY